MDFNYGFERNNRADGPAYDRYVRYGYENGTPQPKIEVLEEPAPPLHPLRDQGVLTAGVFSYVAQDEDTPLYFAADRARIGKRQIYLLLGQLSARHSMNDHIRKEIEYSECRLGAQLDEIMERPFHLGNEGRFEGELLKQLEQLKKERRAEDIACWRDSTRLLTDICDRWSDYSNESRKARLMDVDL